MHHGHAHGTRAGDSSYSSSYDSSNGPCAAPNARGKRERPTTYKETKTRRKRTTAYMERTRATAGGSDARRIVMGARTIQRVEKRSRNGDEGEGGEVRRSRRAPWLRAGPWPNRHRPRRDRPFPHTRPIGQKMQFEKTLCVEESPVGSVGRRGGRAAPRRVPRPRRSSGRTAAACGRGTEARGPARHCAT